MFAMPLIVVLGLIVLAIIFPIVGGAEMLVVSAVILLGALAIFLLDRRTKKAVGGRERETDVLANRPG